MTYNTEWQEPGINCESCHGPAREHINVYAMADSGEVLTDGKIISTKHFSPSQHNSSCGSCHAKMIPVRESFIPGTDFYDAFDLVTVENPDFYPDGRDLGENYTFTSWEMNSCKDKSNLNCITCHTSSGRNKFRDNPNSSCLPCHEEKVSDPAHHTRHNPEGEGSLCISCHMPRTEFARMKRSDHSFRPPTPAATMEFGSPNACNICHSDKSARWANEIVVKQRGNYQYEILKLGRMMKEARLNDWKNAKLITEDMKNERINKVFATAFIRLAERYEADQMNEAILAGTKHPSPLVRAAAAHAMTFPFDNETIEKLIDLSADSSYIVRLSAGYSLAKMPFEMLLQHDTAVIIPVIREYAASLVIRKDHWGSWYNLGNFYAGAGDAGSALTAYDMALAINPEATVALVNAGFIYSQTGAQTRSEEYFLRALDVDSLMEAANLNLALLYGETGRLPEARKYLERTLAINPRSHVAAYNLAIIISDYDIQKALNLSKISVKYGNGSDKYQKLHDLLLERVSEKDRK